MSAKRSPTTVGQTIYKGTESLQSEVALHPASSLPRSKSWHLNNSSLSRPHFLRPENPTMKLLSYILVALTAPLTLAAPTTSSFTLREASPLEPRDLRTQHVVCYNEGWAATRASLYFAIGEACRHYRGMFIADNGVTYQYVYRHSQFSESNVVFEVRAEGGCSFTIEEWCTDNFRKPLDECNPGSDGGGTPKQGGMFGRIRRAGGGGLIRRSFWDSSGRLVKLSTAGGTIYSGPRLIWRQGMCLFCNL